MDFAMRNFEICMGIQSATWISRVKNAKTKSIFFLVSTLEIFHPTTENPSYLLLKIN